MQICMTLYRYYNQFCKNYYTLTITYRLHFLLCHYCMYAVKCLTSFIYMQQPYMITAVEEMAAKNVSQHDANTAKFLTACNKLFEEGILSHLVIDSMRSQVIKNMDTGYKFFEQWRESLASSDLGMHFYMQNILCATCMHTCSCISVCEILLLICTAEVNLGSPLQKSFLA